LRCALCSPAAPGKGRVRNCAPGIEAPPAIAKPPPTPDSRRLYCTDDDLHPPAKNESQIYAIDVATGPIATLISGGVNTYPVMSPDGRRIAFRRMVQTINSEVLSPMPMGRMRAT
jgi:Tol biopolymer transport system component